MNVNTILSDVLSGARMSEEEAAFLFGLKGREVWKVAEAADELRERKVGNAVTYVRNMNIHLTNICKNRCGLCGFGSGGAPSGGGRAYCVCRRCIPYRGGGSRHRTAACTH